jgi:hypothetical protein
VFALELPDFSDTAGANEASAFGTNWATIFWFAPQSKMANTKGRTTATPGNNRP